MSDWANFFLWGLGQIVNTVFNLDLGIGFTLGDLEVACLVIGLVATALVVKTGSFVSVSHDTNNIHKSENMSKDDNHEFWTKQWRVGKK